MKLSSEQLEQSQECTSVDELISRAAAAGHSMTREQAQKIIDSVSMVEIGEDSLDQIAGGGSENEYYKELTKKDGKTCPYCQSTDTYVVDYNEYWYSSENQCRNPACGKRFTAFVDIA